MRIMLITTLFCLAAGCTMVEDKRGEPVTIDRDANRNKIACMDNDVNKRCIDPATPLTY